MTIRLYGIVALALSAGSIGAAARDVTPAEGAALKERFAAFDAAMRDGRTGDVIGALPPRVIETVAAKANRSPSEVRAAIVEQTDAALRNVKSEAFGMALDKARKKELPDGTPYLLVPSRMVMDAGTGRIEVVSDTLAMLENGAWYLLDLADPGRAVQFGLIYPEYKGVEFGGITIKAVP